MVLDRFRPGTGGRIADVLQLPEQLGEPATAVSPAMIRLAVKHATEALAASDWASLWNRGRTTTRSSALLIALLVPTLFAALAPHAARLSVARWLLGSSERWPQRTYLTVTGLGDRKRLLAPRDEPFALEVRADLPAIEPRDGKWIVRGRGEPLVLRNRPQAPEAPDRGAAPRADGQGRGPRYRDDRDWARELSPRVASFIVVDHVRVERRRRLARSDQGGTRRPAGARE